MNDAALVGVLDGVGDVEDEGDAVAGGQGVVAAEIGEGFAFDVFDDEVGEAGVGLSGVEDSSDVGMVGAFEGAAFELEAGGGFGVDGGVGNDLDGDEAVDGLVLLGEEDVAAAAAPDSAEDGVGSDGGGELRSGSGGGGGPRGGGAGRGLVVGFW